MDFRGVPAARAADRLFMLPAFPPLAERCALIEVESMDKITLSLPQRASASKIACHALQCLGLPPEIGEEIVAVQTPTVRYGATRGAGITQGDHPQSVGCPGEWHGNHNDRAFLMVGVPA